MFEKEIRHPGDCRHLPIDPHKLRKPGVLMTFWEETMIFEQRCCCDVPEGETSISSTVGLSNSN